MTIETSPSIENLASALGKFQAETHGVIRDAVNPFHKNRYATLEAVIETARPGLAKAGLAFLQAPKGQVGNTVEINTMLMHGPSGEWIRFATWVPLTKPDPQGVGSAITYACRYALMATLGLPPMDDDAEATKPQAPVYKTNTEPRPTLPPTGTAVESLNLARAASDHSKKIYIANSIKRMDDMETASQLFRWAKDERKMAWPQYKIELHDEDGQKLVKAYKKRMAEIEKADETETVE